MFLVVRPVIERRLVPGLVVAMGMLSALACAASGLGDKLLAAGVSLIVGLLLIPVGERKLITPDRVDAAAPEPRWRRLGLHIDSSRPAEALAGLIRRESDDGEPEVLDRFDDLDELAELHRLDDVTVGVELIAPEDIGLTLRRRHDDDRRVHETLIRLDLTQYFPSILAGQVQVQEDHVGAGRVSS